MINISIATEDLLSEEVILKILISIGNFNVIHRLGKQGCGYLIKKIDNFNKLANTCHVLVVIDLDNNPSHERYVGTITRNLKPAHENLIFSVPTREVESWLLADRIGLSGFLKISDGKIDRNPDLLDDPKSKLINLAKSCKNPTAKRGIPPAERSVSKVGLSYNTVLCDFVNTHWSIERAAENSESLRRTVDLLGGLN